MTLLSVSTQKMFNLFFFLSKDVLKYEKTDMHSNHSKESLKIQ